MNGMDDALRRILRNAEAKLDAELPFHARPNAADFTVTKHAVRPPVRIPRRTRLRWRWHAWREQVGRKVGGWIAGVDLSEQDL